jgi:membrane protein
MLSKIKQYYDDFIRLLTLKRNHPVASFVFRQIKTILITLRGFKEANIQLRASALTLYTIMSIVPVLAMIFGIAKGFGFDAYLKEVITEHLGEQKEILNTVLQFVDHYLGKINGGYITGVGFIILIWSVMQVMGNIESSFNKIWCVKKSRMLTRKFTDYISLLLIVPVLIIIASSVNVAQVESVSKSIPFLSYLHPMLKGLVQVLSFTLIWFVFTLIYIVIPNTNVKFKPALTAGIIAGTMFQILQWAYVNFQSYLSGYGMVYGTFAAIPLFLIWLETSWLILLLGVEISYANQNADNYEHETDQLALSHYNRKIMTLLIMSRITKGFVKGEPAINAVQIANQLEITPRLVREIIDDLVKADLLSEIMTEDLKEVAYQPSIDPNRITVNFILGTLDRKGNKPIFIKDPEELNALTGLVESYYTHFMESPDNKLLKDI